MARPEPTGEDLPLVARPHELPASSLASYMGSNQVHVPWTDDRPVSASTCQLPLADNVDGRAPFGWLGVQVFTPHARPMYVGVQADKARGVQGAIDLVVADLRDLPQGLYDTVLPLRPQRHPGYLSLLRFPSIVGDPRGLDAAAIGIDLTRVGGNFFPVILPKTLAYDDFLAYVLPNTADDDAPLLFIVGMHREAWRPGRDFQFRDAEVVTVVRQADAQFYRGTAAALFADGAVWDPLCHLPRAVHDPGHCVLYEDDRFFVEAGGHFGRTILEAVAQKLQRDAADITTCFFTTPNFAMQGRDCVGLLSVVDLPHPALDTLQAARRDIFTHIDCRALGVKPHVVHSHFPALHLPSIAALLDLRLPPTHHIAVLGGRVSGEDVYVQGHSTLILYAASNGLAPDAGPYGRPHSFWHRRHEHEDRSRSRDHLPGERAARSGGHPAFPASSRRTVPTVSAAGAGRQQACLCAAVRPALDACVEGVESAIFLCPSGNQVCSSSDALGLSSTAPDVMKAKGPAAPTEAQGQAIANLVFHGEADLLPAPFHRFGDFPPGANADPVATVSSEEDEEQGPEQSRLHCVFQIFAIDHAPQSVSVVLETPCTSADALAAVHEGVEAAFYRQFPRLLEVKPQPFSAWGCLLALPEWTHSESVVLLDLSAYDGRCFAATVPSPFSVAQLFRIARLPDTADLEVFALGAPRPMLEDDLMEAVEAGSVVFKPRGARWVVQGTSLQLMLWRGPAAWNPDPVFPPTASWLLSFTSKPGWNATLYREIPTSRGSRR